MQVEFEWKSGLVFGLEAGVVYEVEDTETIPDFDENIEHQVIYLHLGILTLCFIF